MLCLLMGPPQTKPLPGLFKMEARLLDEKELSSLAGRIDPSYVPVQPAGSDVCSYLTSYEETYSADLTFFS